MKEDRRYQSWGRYHRRPQQAVRLISANSPMPPCLKGGFLPFGNGRTYGDSCLNDEGALLDCIALDRIIDVDTDTGIVIAESGVLLGDLISRVIPHGWFVAVTPGTQYVTLGGAVANDVHGKNHAVAGTFGRHVRALELRTTDGGCHRCSPTENPALFAATIGGLGLTGVITRVELQLRRVESAYLDQEVIKFSHLDDFFRLDAESADNWEYRVAWIDCLARGSGLGRGLYMRANHSPSRGEPLAAQRPTLWTWPVELPFSLVNAWSVSCFNALYYARQRQVQQRSRVSYQSFFYPLDAIRHWNRLYGQKGFLQYQCVLPPDVAQGALQQMLALIAAEKSGSFLVVLKSFGEGDSPGLLSFPRRGFTLALDFPNRGERTLALLEQLDAITRRCDGAVYPAKDARMSAASFQQYYPNWRQLQARVDPGLTSNFWRRVTTSGAEDASNFKVQPEER